MSTAFEEEEDLAPAYPPHGRPDREITLSSSTLLGIFFALVLVCGLFFGFGYTLGRRAPADAAELPSNPGAPNPATAAAQPTALPKPSASQTQGADAHAAVTEVNSAAPQPAAPVEESTPAATVQEASLPARSAYVPAQATAPTASPIPAVTVAPSVPSPAAAAPATLMVQIAAVSNPADAEVLIGALHKRGYSVITRHEPGDSLMHVQIGPFSTRAEAVAMRQKLLSDGYNAILK